MAQVIGHKNTWKITLLNNWPRIMGDLHHHVRLEKIEGNTLVLGVYDASWLQELYLLAGQLRANINAQFDAPHVKQLRFKQVVRHRTKRPTAKTPQREHTTTQRALTAQEHKALANIQDPQLHSALKQFLARLCHQEKK